MKSTALTSGEPTRLMALLIAEPRPAFRTGTELISAVVSGATSMLIPIPKTTVPSITSVKVAAGGIRVAGSARSSRQGSEPAGIRVSQMSPSAMSSGPTVMNSRGPKRAESCPAGVDRNVSSSAVGMLTAPAANGV